MPRVLTDIDCDPSPENLDPASPDTVAHAPPVSPDDDDEITVELLPPTIPEGVPSPLGDESAPPSE